MINLSRLFTCDLLLMFNDKPTRHHMNMNLSSDLHIFSWHLQLNADFVEEAYGEMLTRMRMLAIAPTSTRTRVLVRRVMRTRARM